MNTARTSSPALLPALALVLALAGFASTPACGDTDPRPPAADTGIGADVGDSACGPGARLCDGTCATLLSDEANCGDCGVVCDSSEVCEDGRCICPEGAERCGRACVDTLSSPEHCGGCGTPCGVGEVCQSGTCALQCTGGDVACSGGCVDTDTSAAHCGACDRPCTAGSNETATCSDGACIRACVPDWYDIDGLRGCEYFCAPTLDGDEICDGEDNDCDGLVDDADPDYEAPLCPLQDGVCAGATARCVDGSLRDCDALDYADQAAPRPWDDAFETWCDGLDNDCNGLADDTCCLPADLPIDVPPAAEPPNMDSYAVFTALPLDGAPLPAVVAPALVTRDGDASSWIDLVTFPSQGGFGSRVALFGGSVTDVDVVYLDAIWNDEVVVYVRYLASGIVARRTYALSGEFGGETTLTLDEGVGAVRDLVARPLDDGDELILMIGDDGGAKYVWAGRTDGDEVSLLRRVSGELTNPEAIDIVPTDTGARACVFVPERSPPIVCYELTDELGNDGETELPGTPSPQIRPAFARAGTGWVYHHPTEDGARVLATTVAADGTVSQTDSSVGTQEGFVVGGAITSGELGLLTLREQDAEASLFRVDFTVPSRGASVIASYEGTGVAPAAVVSAGGSSYVVVHARRYDPELVSQRPYAFPLSREGDALCLED